LTIPSPRATQGGASGGAWYDVRGFNARDGRHAPRRLPTVTIWEKRYFIDERLGQLRNVEAPHDFIDLR
jgi:hypothetical protein